MGKTRVTVQEDTPASEVELQWMAELKELHGERLLLNNVSDIDLLRFCRAYINEEDPKATTFRIISEYLQWREDEKIDEIAATEFERYVDFVKLWPCGFSGIDKSEHPIYFDCIGQMDPSTFSKTFEMSEYVKIHIQMMESLQDIKTALSERLGKPVYKHTVVIDLEGMGLKHMWDRTAMSKLVEVDSTKYPETLHKMLLINPPFLFKAIYAIFGGLLDETTKSRIHVLKSPAELLEHIDASQLPEKYGGLIKYPKDVPLFSIPFATAEGSESKFDDIFSGLLEKRQRRLEELKAKRAMNDVETPDGAEATTTTTTTTTTTNTEPVVQEDKPIEDKPIGEKTVEETMPEELPVENKAE